MAGEDLEQQGPQDLGEGPAAIAKMAAEVEEERGSGPDGAVREVPAEVQSAADRRIGTDRIFSRSKDFMRAGMDPADPNNYGVGPDGIARPRLSEEKASYVAQKEAQTVGDTEYPAVKDIEETYSAAAADEVAARAAKEEAFKGDSDGAYIAAVRATEQAQETRVEAKIDREDAIRAAERAYENELDAGNKAA